MKWLAALCTLCLLLLAAPVAAASCEGWNNRAFFKTATLKAVTDCLKNGADLHARTENGSTPLHFAAHSNKNPAVIAALVKAGADVNARNVTGWTSLHFAASQTQNPAVIDVLVKAGSDPNARDEDGDTPLHFAALGNLNPAVIDALLDAGANPKARNIDGKTPWDYAKKNDALKGTKAYWRLNEGRF